MRGAGLGGRWGSRGGRGAHLFSALFDSMMVYAGGASNVSEGARSMRPSQCSSLGQTPTNFFFRSQQLDEMTSMLSRGDEGSFSLRRGEEMRARRTLSTPSRGHRAGVSAPRVDTAFDGFARLSAASAAAPTGGEYYVLMVQLLSV